MPLAIILTNDWELFGDGSGDYFELQHKPLFELFPVLKDNDAKITLMAEVFQQWHFASLAEKSETAREISNGWIEAVSETIRQKSDVQLHLHPQWLNAEIKDGKPELNMSQWALSSLSSDDISGSILIGKQYLENILRKVNPDYKCTSFRAGAYCIQPEKAILSALKNAGFSADVSVTKGLTADHYYNFKNAYSDVLPWYCRDEDINSNSGNPLDILEIPIHSFKRIESAGLKKFLPEFYYKYILKIPAEEVHWQREKERVKNIRYPSSHRYYKKYQQKGLKFYLSAILSVHTSQLDYDHLTPTEFLRVIKNLMKRNEFQELHQQGKVLPIVASGHLKDIHNTGNIKAIIEGLRKEYRDEIAFLTLSEAIELWKKQN